MSAHVLMGSMLSVQWPNSSPRVHLARLGGVVGLSRDLTPNTSTFVRHARLSSTTRTPVKHLDSETHNGTQKCNRKHPSNHIHEGFPLSLSHFTNSHENYRWSRGYLSGSMQCVTVRPRGHALIHT